MKNYVLFWVFALSTIATFAQFDYGNDWYRANSDKTFIRLVVEEDGLYRVTLQDLLTAGHDLSTVPPANLQVFYRGREIPIYVQSNGSTLSYVEFFGFANDGKMDSVMYRDPVTGVLKDDLQPSKEFSIFTDESVYFLTWDDNPVGLRVFNTFDPTYNLYTPESFFAFETRQDYHPNGPNKDLSQYLFGGGGSFDTFYTLNSDYVTGEGYMGPGFGYIANPDPVNNPPLKIQMSTPLAANTGRPVTLKTRIFGRSNTQHILNVSMAGQGVVIDSTVGTNSVYMHTYGRTFNLNGNLSENSELTFEALRGSVDNNHVSWASLTYDRLTDMLGDSTIKITDWEKGTRAYFQFDNAVGDDSVYVYDLTNRIRQVGVMNGTEARVIIFPFNGKRDLYLTTDRGIKKPRIEGSKLNRLYDRQGKEYVIIAHRDLKSSAEAMAQYRDTATVNPLSTMVVYTDEIYDEFGYGSLTPWAIKRFCKYALDNWSIKPEYFMLWGKGRYETRKFVGAEPLVPTFGYPATDYEFVSHFDLNSLEINPEAAIGRVNVLNDAMGIAYLNKVNDYEHKGWERWMKQGVFLGGGNTRSEQNAIEDAFSFYIDVYQSLPFGGKANYFQKRSDDITIDPATASYHDQISDGVSVVHFFGHSTSNILDISLRPPNQYNNFNRYTFMIAMGCYGGDFAGASVSTSFGETWVSEANRGAIGYLANSSAGYLNPLKQHGRVFYNDLYRRMNGQPIGKVIQETLRLYTDSLQGIQYRNHGRQLNLQGDPAVTIFFPQRPDLEVNESSVYFTPENFTAQDDSFQINIVVSNFGLVTDDSITVEVRQQLPNGTIYNGHPKVRIPMVAFRDTVSFILKNPVGNEMTGQNFFEVFIDPENNVEEYFENNNYTKVAKLVAGNIAAILYPQEYGIVAENKISLKASAFFMTPEEDIPFIFEIDTVYRFSSSFKQTSPIIQGRATFVEWELPFDLEPEQVYYWRVRLADVEPVSWSTASFKYIPGKEGWAQAKFPQFLRNTPNDIKFNEFQGKVDFNTFGGSFEFIGENGGRNFIYNKNGVLKGNARENGFSTDGVLWVILDRFTLEEKSGSQQLGIFDAATAPTTNSPGQMFKLREAIYNLNEGDYIAIGTRRNPKVPLWDPSIFDALKQVGVSDNIRLLKDGEGFLILGRKGNSPGTAVEVYEPQSGTNLILDKDIYSSETAGSLTSTRVGPAIEWDDLLWDWNSQDLINQENTTVDVYGIRPNGTKFLLKENLSKGTHDLSDINSGDYPYLELKANLEDTVYRTAPQMDNWHVFYEPATDAVVDLITNFEFRSDTVFEGEDVFIHMAARNIGSRDLDSIDVALSVEREDRTRLILDTLRIAPLLVNGGAVEFEYNFNTIGKELSGDVLYLVEINPELKQPEIHFFNNIYVRPFYVVNDDKNPILDVTFDGKHIMDGDIVSPQPEIIIEVNDENQFVAVDDTNTFELYFKRGVSAGIEFERIFIEGEPRIDWQPGQLPENRARLYFNPGMTEPLEDGEYTLRVQGQDKNGNAAGRGGNFYEIKFSVENASTITQVLNYPNPFSTSTRFVYTLTGADLPELFQIHIYTISGRMVKMIDLLELGEVYFGHNITNYAWDGTDEYGDPLANGVYLYRVVMKMPGEEIQVRDEKTKRFFNNGWGKMVIMR
ncbi:MAG: C25 family cysteine peptidase [Bacteroidota bacterium]